MLSPDLSHKGPKLTWGHDERGDYVASESGQRQYLAPNATRAERNAAARLVSGFVDAKTGIAIAMGAQPTQKPSGPPLVAQTDGKLRRKQLAERERYDAIEREKANAAARVEDRKEIAREVVAELTAAIVADAETPEPEPAADTIGYNAARDVAREAYVDALISKAPAERIAETRAALLKFGEPPAAEGGANE